MTSTKITNLKFEKSRKKKKFVSRIYFQRSGKNSGIAVSKEDRVFVTLGSLVANSSIGSMTKAPAFCQKKKDVAWTLWENIVKENPEFGTPWTFNTHTDKSKWISFTLTFRDKTFFNLMDKFIHKKVTAFGGVNLVDSNWLTSIVLTYKPYFLNQPKDVDLCWGFSLRSDEKGNFVDKKMSQCSGEEILTELVCHLGFKKQLKKILKRFRVGLMM